MQITLSRAKYVNIYSIESEYYDIHLNIPVNGYAVLIPSYFKMDPIICKTQNAAKYHAKKLINEGYGPTIIDEHGSYLDYDIHTNNTSKY